MSIDKLQLPPLLIASLFNNKLVDLRENPEQNDSNTTTDIDYLGGNKKRIVFVVKNDEQKFLHDFELAFLLNMISACNITMDDISIVNINNSKAAYKQLVSNLQTRKMLCFGVSSVEIDLPFTIPFYQVQTFEEVQYLFCPELSRIENDNEAKKLLWESLRKIFNLGRNR